MLVGPNGRPIVKSEGPTGRAIQLIEVMTNGVPSIQLGAKGEWFKDNSPPEILRGRLLMCTYMMNMATSILKDILGTFVDKDVEQEVQKHMNTIAKGAKENGV
jgi:hypothetical protein